MLNIIISDEPQQKVFFFIIKNVYELSTHILSHIFLNSKINICDFVIVCDAMNDSQRKKNDDVFNRHRYGFSFNDSCCSKKDKVPFYLFVLCLWASYMLCVCVCVCGWVYKMFIKCSISLIWILIVCSSCFLLKTFACDPHTKKLKSASCGHAFGFASSQSRRWWLHQKKNIFSSMLKKLSLSFSLLLDF